MRRVIAAVFALALCLAVAAQGAQSSSSAQSSSLQLGSITRSQLLQRMNKQVQIEGFFYDGSIPMLVQSMEVVRNDTPLPRDKYIPIIGTVPPSFKSGAKVRVAGQLQKPGDEKLSGENVAISISKAGLCSVLRPPQ